MSKKQAASLHWRRTRKLTFTTLAIWFFFSFVIHWFGAELNARLLYGGARLTHRLCHSDYLVGKATRND